MYCHHYCACTEFLRYKVKHFIPIKNKKICSLQRPRPLRHPLSSPSPSLLPPSALPSFMPSPSFCRRDHSCRPRQRLLPSTIVTVSRPPPLLPSPSPSSPSLAFIAAFIAVAAVTLPLSVTRHPRRRLHHPRCCRCHRPRCRPSPSSLSPLSSLPFVARHPRCSNILFQLRIK